jgi:epoxyqueuosine reductase
MRDTTENDLGDAIVAAALDCGADLAGIASVADLKRAPSHLISERLPDYAGTGTVDAGGRRRGLVTWPEGARSAVVLALSHPEDEPELDWWTGDDALGDPAGNKLLIAAARRLADRLTAQHGLECWPIAYHVERGGIYLKDAAVLAGLGRVGHNNLLLTPQYGPHLRLRAVLTSADLPSTGPSAYDPCEGCPEPCRAACPQAAFPGGVFSPGEYGQTELPGRDGSYDRLTCSLQMQADEAVSEFVTRTGEDQPIRVTRYCRACESACIAGV